MHEFFAYTYDAHEKHIHILREIARRINEFAQFVDSADLNVAKINRCLVECSSLFNQLPFGQVKNLMPFFPYRLFENLATIIAKSKSINELVFEEQQYKLIAKTIAALHPYIVQLQELHHDASITTNDGDLVEARGFDERKFKLSALHVRSKKLIECQQRLTADLSKSEQTVDSFCDGSEAETPITPMIGSQSGEDSEEDSMLMDFSFSDEDYAKPKELSNEEIRKKIAENQQEIDRVIKEKVEAEKKYFAKYNKQYIHWSSASSSNSDLSVSDGSTSDLSAFDLGVSDSRSVPMIYTALEDAVRQNLRSVNEFLEIHIDNPLISQLKIIKNFLEKIVYSNEQKNIFSLYTILTFSNEVIHAGHLLGEHYYTAIFEKLRCRINFFRNQIVHGLDHKNTLTKLKETIVTDVAKMHGVESLLIQYIDMLLDPVSKANQAKQENLVLFFSSVAKSFDMNFVVPQQPSSLILPVLFEAKEIKAEKAPEEILKNHIFRTKDLINQILVIKNITIFFKEYCIENDLSTGKIKKLFFKIGLLPIYYDALSEEDLEKRLMIQGMIQVLGEITGTLKRESYLNELHISVQHHKVFEDFVLGVTDYRNASTHRLRHDDLTQALTVLNTIAESHFNVLQKEVEARLALEESALAKMTEMLNNHDDKSGKLSQAQAILRDVFIKSASLKNSPIKLTDAEDHQIDRSKIDLKNICCVM